MSSVQDSKKPDLRRRNRRLKVGDAKALRRLLWRVLDEVDRLSDDVDFDAKLKAASTIATLSGIYLRVVEQHDLADKVVSLRAELERVKAEQDAERIPRAA